PLLLGEGNTPDSEIAKSFVKYDADFDTGNSFLKIFNGNLMPEVMKQFTNRDFRTAVHTSDVEYSFFEKTMKLATYDSSRKLHSTVDQVRLVKYWDTCSVLENNKNRIGFVGRDMLRKLGIRITLDPHTKTTRVMDIE
ncbi:MAG: hypothetical protein ACREA4_05600, partial [Nitrososphaera sp.]